MLKRILAVIGGVIIAALLTSFIENLSSRVYPVDLNRIQAAKSFEEIEDIVPTGALLFVLCAYALGAFGGGLVSTLIEKRKSYRSAIITGFILTTFGIINIIEIPQPMWMNIATVVIFFPFVLLGARLVKR